MKNSIFQDGVNHIVFYDGKVFKSTLEFTEYLKLNYKLTESGVSAILAKLPQLKYNELMHYLDEAKVTSPKRCAKIKELVTKEVITDGYVIDRELQNFWTSPDEPKTEQTEKPTKISKKKKKKKH